VVSCYWEQLRELLAVPGARGPTCRRASGAEVSGEWKEFGWEEGEGRRTDLDHGEETSAGDPGEQRPHAGAGGRPRIEKLSPPMIQGRACVCVRSPGEPNQVATHAHPPTYQPARIFPEKAEVLWKRSKQSIIDSQSAK
jgi:hypothetical protein